MPSATQAAICVPHAAVCVPHATICAPRWAALPSWVPSTLSLWSLRAHASPLCLHVLSHGLACCVSCISCPSDATGSSSPWTGCSTPIAPPSLLPTPAIPVGRLVSCPRHLLPMLRRVACFQHPISPFLRPTPPFVRPTPAVCAPHPAVFALCHTLSSFSRPPPSLDHHHLAITHAPVCALVALVALVALAALIVRLALAALPPVLLAMLSTCLCAGIAHARAVWPTRRRIPLRTPLAPPQRPLRHVTSQSPPLSPAPSRADPAPCLRAADGPGLPFFAPWSRVASWGVVFAPAPARPAIFCLALHAVRCTTVLYHATSPCCMP
ncbi:hypothetical protein DENSPDRAFT_886397 [Dentipellis sp. KUC8613]|nr:hypothetical protein DENSPDRAFT_886397 [Dentipellis sp. KUC8613]